MVGVDTLLLQSGSVPTVAYFAVPVVLLVLLWGSLVIPSEDAVVALLRDGEVVRTTDELTLTVPFVTERRTVPTDERAIQVGPTTVETADGVTAEVEGQLFCSIDDVETFATETDSASALADRVEEACRPDLERTAARTEFHRLRERLEDDLERTGADAVRRSGASVERVRAFTTPRDLPEFYPYHERFERRDGQLYATLDGTSVRIADVFYDEGTDLAACKLLDVDLEEETETLTEDGADVEVTQVTVPENPERSWSGAPKFAADGTPYTATPDGERVSVYRLFDLDAVDAATMETVGLALPDDVDTTSMVVWGSDGSVVRQEASLLDVLSAAA